MNVATPNHLNFPPVSTATQAKTGFWGVGVALHLLPQRNAACLARFSRKVKVLAADKALKRASSDFSPKALNPFSPVPVAALTHT